jgi:ribonucleoside-diphosphate reductase beta chain
MFSRANRKLKELMLDTKYNVDEELLKNLDWFYIVTAGEQQTDFFFNHETSYSKPNDDWNEDMF